MQGTPGHIPALQGRQGFSACPGSCRSLPGCNSLSPAGNVATSSLLVLEHTRAVASLLGLTVPFLSPRVPR